VAVEVPIAVVGFRMEDEPEIRGGAGSLHG
jgi:hypothetical protein